MYCPGSPGHFGSGPAANERQKQRERKRVEAEVVGRWKKADELSEIMEWLSRKITVIYPEYEPGSRRAEK